MIGQYTEAIRGTIIRIFISMIRWIITTHRNLMHLKVNGEVKNHWRHF